MLNRHGHRGSRWRWRSNIHTKIGVFGCFHSGWSEGCDVRIALNKLREVLKETFDATRAVKHQNIIFHIAQVAQIRTNSAIHHGFAIIDPCFIQELWNRRLHQITARQNVGFSFVFFDVLHQVLKALLTEEDFALPIDDILL